MPGKEMRVSRRDFLKTGLTLGAAGAGGLLGGGLLSGCGTGNTVKAFTASTAGKPRMGGTLRAGLTGGSSADTLDPLNAITNVDFSRIDNLYEPLIGLNPDAQPIFVLADGAHAERQGHRVDAADRAGDHLPQRQGPDRR